MSQNVKPQNVKPQVKPQDIHQASRDRQSPNANPTVNPPLPLKGKVADFQPGESSVLATKMNVDSLMDEVFGDIERMLERGGSLTVGLAEAGSADGDQVGGAIEPFHKTKCHKTKQPLSGAANSEPVSPSEAPSESLPSPFSSLALLPKLSPRQLKPEDPIEDEEFDLFPTPPEAAESSRSRPLDILLMAVALLSLVAAAGLWIFVRTKLPQLTQAANVPTAEEVLQAKHDAEFLGYVSRALERIDRASQQTSPLATPGTPATALDPLFVPLPPPPPIAMAAPAPVVPTPRISVVPLSPAPVAPPVAPSTVPPVAPSVAVAASTPVPTNPSVPNIAPSPTHTLIGLLELGDRSAALFEIDGAPQRIQVGEKFGASGWTLVSVSGEEAIVRRNGDVRSVFIGQKF